MASSSPQSTGPSHEAQQQSLAADSTENINSPAPNLQIPVVEPHNQPLGMSLGQDLNSGSISYQPPPPGQAYPLNNLNSGSLGYQPPPPGQAYLLNNINDGSLSYQPPPPGPAYPLNNANAGSLSYQPPPPGQVYPLNNPSNGSNDAFAFQPLFNGNAMMLTPQGGYQVVSQGSGNVAHGSYIHGPIIQAHEAQQSGIFDHYNSQFMKNNIEDNVGNNDDDDSDSEFDSDDGGVLNSNQEFVPTIRSEEQYKNALTRQLRKSVRNDNTSDIPQTEEEKVALVKQLFESIMNTMDVLDKPSKNGKPAQAVRRLRSRYYSKKRVEKRCWEILTQCRDVAMGLKISGSDPHSKKEDYDGFKPRFQKIVDSCRVSKALCKQVLDPTFISRLVTAPGAEIQMKVNNKKINAERDIQNEIGRKAVKRGINLDNLDLIPDPEEAFLTPLPDQDEEELKLLDDAESTVGANSGEGDTVTPNNQKTPKRAALPKKAIRSTSTSTTLSTKRKSTESYEENDNGEDIDSDYQTPVKRTRVSTKSRATATPTPRRAANKASRAANTNMLPNNVFSENGNATGPNAVTPTGGVGALGQEFANTNLTNNSDQTTIGYPPGLSNSLPNTAPWPGQTYAHGNLHNSAYAQGLSYKEAICRLLGIDSMTGTAFSLYHLRVYARAYNEEFTGRVWRHAPNYIGNGHELVIEDGSVYCGHFAQVITDYGEIARLRGDLSYNMLYNEDFGNIGFPTQTEPHIRQALGLDPNPFGLHDDQGVKNVPAQFMPNPAQLMPNSE